MDEDDAALVAALFAVDPVGLGGVWLRGPAGPGRSAWLADLRALLPPAGAWRRVPPHIDDDRLLGGLDLGASLQAGRVVAQRGLLAEADGGVLELAMAERLTLATVARLTTVLDTQELQLARDGVLARHPARLGVVALDEGLDDEQPPAALLDRLALRLDILIAPPPAGLADRAAVAAACERLAAVRVDDEILRSLCATALALGVASARAALLALRVARAAAALAGQAAVGQAEAALAARLVLAPRATRWPADDTPAPDEQPASPQDEAGDASSSAPQDGPIEDQVLEAAKSAIPPGLLAALQAGEALRARATAAGRRGALRRAGSHGRPLGSTRGDPRGGARLDLLATLRAAAPWQRLRRVAAPPPSAPVRLQIRRDDFRIRRFQQHSETTTIFAVDASGSAALHRLAEAKGAVELLLADCYVRRDRVAVLAFRGQGAELLLPPTRSLLRAKRSLAGLPGGGGTPLAAALELAHALADAERRRGITPLIVLLTDGRANIARHGAPGRQAAGVDALAAARLLRAENLRALLIDTSPQPQPQPQAHELACAMGATYLPLPHAAAAEMSQAVRAAARPGR